MTTLTLEPVLQPDVAFEAVATTLVDPPAVDVRPVLTFVNRHAAAGPARPRGLWRSPTHCRAAAAMAP